MGKRPVTIAVGLVLCFWGTGCGLIPSDYEKHWVQLKKEWNALLTVMSGGRSPLAKGSPLPSPLPSASPSPVASEYASSAAIISKANAELLHEVFVVVYQREPQDRSEFGSYVDTLNQGASFEGVYNGFTHSSNYRELEAANQGASPESLRIFSQELAGLEAELPEPTHFDERSAQPLAMPVTPSAEGGSGSGVAEVQFGVTGAASPRPVDTKVLADRYVKQFVGASIYTLKRVLSDEAMKVMAAKRVSRAELVRWYSKWVVHMCNYQVNFGLALRNKADEQFHYQWALGVTDDRLTWEVLNRIHRVLNEANRQKQ